MNTIKITAGATRLIAHRGLSGLERENSAAAFVAAGNRSYYGIETDLYRTLDGNFIINHDGYLSNVAGENITIEQATFDTLRSIRMFDNNSTEKRADLHLPSLEEYVGICRRYEKICILELKSGFTVEELERIVARIEAMGYLDNVTFISFGYENLLRLRQIRPNVSCQFLTGDCSDAMLERLHNDKIDLDISYPALNAERVAAAHEAGILVNCWTVDSAEDAQRLVSYGVDFITTNILEAKDAGYDA